MSWTDMADRVLKRTISTFKVAATYTPATGSAYALNGVFAKPYQAVQPQNSDAVVSSSHMTFGVRLADMAAAPTEGDRVTIGGVTYDVFDPQGDGEGGITLSLHKVG